MYFADDWRVEATKLVPNILSTAGCLQVLLLVFLRLLAITQPFTYIEIHKKLRHISIAIIWVVSFCVCMVPVLAVLLQCEITYEVSRVIVLHGFHTLPIICIVGLYVKLIITIHNTRASVARKNNSVCVATMRNNRNMSIVKVKQMRMMTRIVVCLIVCYVPYIVWWAYVDMVIRLRKPYIIYTAEVIAKGKLKRIS